MKKVSSLNKAVVAVVIIASFASLMLSTISLVVALRTENFANNNLLQHTGENRGKINTIIDCIHGNKNACLPEVLDTF
jgi:broad-specificity NMP kinase